MTEISKMSKLSEETAAELQSRAEQAERLLRLHCRSSEGLNNLFAPLPQIRQDLTEALNAAPDPACEPQSFLEARLTKIAEEIRSVLKRWPKELQAESPAGRSLSEDELRLAEETLALRSRFEELRRLPSLLTEDASLPSAPERAE